MPDTEVVEWVIMKVRRTPFLVLMGIVLALVGLGFAAMSTNPPFFVPNWVPILFFALAGIVFLGTIFWSAWPRRKGEPPRFECKIVGYRMAEKDFAPFMNIRQVFGDYVLIEWRFRGPRFQSDWKQPIRTPIENNTLLGEFDLSLPVGDKDKHLGTNEMGLELRYHWQGRTRHELHRWPLTQRPTDKGMTWQLNDEIQPPLYWEGK